MGQPALVVHGHFYQPPRENPWTESVTRETTAAPFHDWNERITAESYRPNGWARVVDDHGRVVAIVNNYRRLSFNIGPTLLSWMESAAPATYARIVEADHESHRAIAQAYGHLILPLANDRDVRTQIRWGLADFAHRFGRPSEGIWLPETAADDRVLAILAEEGVGFTVLAPAQAVAVRPSGEDPGDPADAQERLPIEAALSGHGDPDHGGEPAHGAHGPDGGWRDVSDGTIDTSRTYRWVHPDDPALGIDIVFYDGALAQAVAFGLAGMSSEQFVERVVGASEERTGGDVVAIAADGETFGHHQIYGDRLMAYALGVEAPRRGIEVMGLADVLRLSPPSYHVRIRESAWSCAHGVGRWREDCGCSTGGRPGWNQAWRAPLRAALDRLRDRAAEIFDRRGAEVLRDPWAARDAYIQVLVGAVSRDDFAAAWVTGDPVVAFSLLEAQRHAMAMYTSCGWFFHDLAGLETIQILRYAARCIDLIGEIGEDADTMGFLHVLSEAVSNDRAEGDGWAVWERHVVPYRVDEARALAQLALEDLLEGRGPSHRVAAWDVEVLDWDRAVRGGLALGHGRVALTHRRTGRRTERVFAALHLGGFEVFGASRPADPNRDEQALSALRFAFDGGRRVTALLRMVVDDFGPDEFGLDSALPDAAERIVARAASQLASRFAAAYDRLYSDHRDTLESLAAAGYPLPPMLRAPAELALARRIEAEVAAQSGSFDPGDYAAAVALARQARAGGFTIDTPQARTTVERLLLMAAERAVGGPDAAARSGAAAAAVVLLDVAEELELHPNVDRAQEILFEALQIHPEWAETLGKLTERLWLAPPDSLLSL